MTNLPYPGTSSSGSKSNETPVTSSAKLCALSWHPTEGLLAAGWDDGTVMLITPHRDFECTIEELPSVPVLAFQWSHSGRILFIVYEKQYVLVTVTKKDESFTAKRKIGDCIVEDTSTHTARMLRYDLLHTNTETRQDSVAVEDDDFESAMKERKRKLGVRMGSAKAVSKVPSGTELLVGCASGLIVGVSEDGKQATVHKFDQVLKFLGFCEEKRLLIVVGEDMVLHQIHVDHDGTTKEKIRIKLSGNFSAYHMILADCFLIWSSHEKEARVWDLENEENGTVSLSPVKGYDAEEVIERMAYCKKKGMISGATSGGKVANWVRRKGDGKTESQWKLQPGTAIGASILSLSWSPLTASCAVNLGSELTILQDENLIACLRNRICAYQTSQTHFVLIHVVSGVSQDLRLPVAAKGVHLGEKQLVIWNKETVMTYDVQSSLATIQSTTFNCSANDIVISQQTLYCIEEDKIVSRTLQGTVKQILSFPEMEGDPQLMSLNKHWLAVATSNGFLRIYDISKKEAKQEFHSKYAIENVDSFHKFTSIKVNNAGKKVACIYMDTPNTIGELLLVWDAEGDHVGYFSFDNGMTDQQQYEAEAERATTSVARPVTAAARKMEREQARYRMMLHRPASIHWDEYDPRYLFCEAVPNSPDVVNSMIISMFVTSEHGVQLNDLQQKAAICDQLIGVSVPNMYFTKRSEFDDDELRDERIVGRAIVAKPIREFAGFDISDEATRKGMMDFCFYLTIGQMDEAFKAIKFIKNESVWEKMATMAVKSKRLDVAAVCLGKMKNVRGARALRKAKAEQVDDNMTSASLALELGMHQEAESLYARIGRFDMVNKINQAQSDWNQAFDVAERHDRIHLRNTHYHYAKYLEAAGSEEEAIENYKKSNTHNFEIPRMLLDNPKALELFIRREREPELHRWWARYLESSSELEGAINFYTAAKDTLSVVRIKSMQGKIEEAAKLALSSGDKAACYHMGKMYEVEEKYAEAVKFYTKAHAYASALRLAKEHNMKDRIANLALIAGGNELIEAARYYEDMNGYAHQAVMLYHKAGMVGRALDLAFRTEQFSALDLVVKDLDSTSEPTTLLRASEFFSSNQNYEKAVELLCMAKEYQKAIDLCRQRNVTVTEKISELMSPNKDTTPDANERKRIFEALAALCNQQGSYQLAAKKYAQSGDKLQAMRSLLKSGDIAKIRFFANTARNREIYILAANFLQTTDWQRNPEITKDIRDFYLKAQSYEHLARFYQACAVMEVQNFSEFDRGTEALEFCLEVLTKVKDSSPSIEELREEVTKQKAQLDQFAKIKSVYARDPADAIRQFQQLAENSTENDIIQPSQILSTLINHHGGKGNWNAAYRAMTQLQKQQPRLDLATVIDPELLDKICDEMRVARVTSTKNEAASDGEDEGGVDFSHEMKRRQRAEAGK